MSTNFIVMIIFSFTAYNSTWNFLKQHVLSASEGTKKYANLGTLEPKVTLETRDVSMLLLKRRDTAVLPTIILQRFFLTTIFWHFSPLNISMYCDFTPSPQKYNLEMCFSVSRRRRAKFIQIFLLSNVAPTYTNLSSLFFQTVFLMTFVAKATINFSMMG